MGALTDNGHGPVILFACVLGGVLELVDKSGGANGLADKARQYANTRTRALLCAWVLSVLVFFDDYSAILIVGSMLKDSLKKVKMSPAKLGKKIYKYERSVHREWKHFSRLSISKKHRNSTFFLLTLLIYIYIFLLFTLCILLQRLLFI